MPSTKVRVRISATSSPMPAISQIRSASTSGPYRDRWQPGGVQAGEAVWTNKARKGRGTASQAKAVTRLWPERGVDVAGPVLDLAALFGRTAPVVLEIGFGMGETTARLAALQPDRDVLAVDVHTPGT